MKYKVGDKVRIKKNLKEDVVYGTQHFVDNMSIYCGGMAIIKNLEDGESYRLNIDNEYWCWTDEMLEENQFTKSDLKDNHIVVDNYGGKRLWGDIAYKEEYKENLSHKCVDNYSINEVWEFDKLVWKREEQILDEVEKKYLSDVIRPFRNRVNAIQKIDYVNNAERIDICASTYLEKKDCDHTTLPSFKKGTMYRNMELYKEYTLKELGLE